MSTDSMNYARPDQTASVLKNGKVLVAGGRTALIHLNSAELYEPSTETWTITGYMKIAREEHTTSMLTNGQVLVTGGTVNYIPTKSTEFAELYDPLTRVWTMTGSMNNKRYLHTACVLTNGKVLVTGGETGSSELNSAELYDPSTGSWTLTDSMNNARQWHTATVLNNGNVLVTGGASRSVSLKSSELYDSSQTLI
ncbi:unnamed protein product [Rotaria sp. Silwood1]|nr:unnamed protein product [Rotaria sp. Silwood1]CAF4994852.1 unnamed protein product [Rotaria sp. Silwood1]